MLRKVLKWAGIAFLGLYALGLILELFGYKPTPAKDASITNTSASSTTPAMKLSDQIDQAILPTDQLVRSQLPHPETATFRNVMAMQPQGMPGFLFCGEVDVVDRNDQDTGYVRFLAIGQTVNFIPYGSIYEGTFQKFCGNAKPLTPVTFN